MTSGDNSKPARLLLEQPQGICDLIGMAFRIWRLNLKLIFRALLLPTIFFFASISIVQWCFTYGINNTSDLPKIISTICLGVVGVLSYIFALVWLSVKQIALVRLFTGFSADFKSALAYARTKTWWVLGLFLISALLSSVVMGIWLCILGLSAAVAATGSVGAVLAAGGMVFAISGIFISFAFLLLVSMMGFTVLCCENTSFFGVIGHAFSWTFKHIGRVLSFGFIFYIIFSAVSMPVSLPVIVASVGDMAVHQIQTGAPAGSDYKISIGVMLFIQVWEAVCSLLLRPVTAIAAGLFYLDLRNRVDGLDMTRKLRELRLANEGADDGLPGH